MYDVIVHKQMIQYIKTSIDKIHLNIENIVMISIKHLDINHIFTLNNI